MTNEYSGDVTQYSGRLLDRLAKRAVSPGFVTGAARALPQTLHEVPPPAPAFVK